MYSSSLLRLPAYGCSTVAHSSVALAKENSLLNCTLLSKLLLAVPAMMSDQVGRQRACSVKCIVGLLPQIRSTTRDHSAGDSGRDGSPHATIEQFYRYGENERVL